MLMAYLLSAMIVAVVCTFFWLIAGGSLAMAFVVYTMSGLLMIVTLASASYVYARGTKD